MLKTTAEKAEFLDILFKVISLNYLCSKNIILVCVNSTLKSITLKVKNITQHNINNIKSQLTSVDSHDFTSLLYVNADLDICWGEKSTHRYSVMVISFAIGNSLQQKAVEKIIAHKKICTYNGLLT